MRTEARLLCAVFGLAGAAAQAQPAQPWSVALSQALSSASNVLLLADGAAEPEGRSRRDLVSSTALAGTLDTSVGRQRLYGNAALRANRYDRNAVYDNDAYNLAAGIEWSTVNRVSGQLDLAASSGLANFGLGNVAGGLLTERNLESGRVLNAAVRLGDVTALAFEANAGLRRVRNSLDGDAVRARNYDEDRQGLAVRWSPRSSTSFSLALQRTQGEYPQYLRVGNDFLPDRFASTALEAGATWLPDGPGGKSRFDVRLAQTRTRYDLNNARDFDGVTGSLGWTWQATGKLQGALRLARDTGQESYGTSAFGLPAQADFSRSTTTALVRVNYQATAKLSAYAQWQSATREQAQTIDVPALGGSLPASDGRDRLTGLALGVRWAITRQGLLGCDYTRDARSASGAFSYAYRNDVLLCSAQYTLN
jgi:hypothetical protein